MPKIDLDSITPKIGSGYPPPHDQPIGKAQFRRLAPAAGVVDFEINHVTLSEGEWSSQRHWHEGEDEFLVMLAGAATLVEETGETPLVAGDCVAFPKRVPNGHHLRGGEGGCVFVVWGKPEATPCHYPDVDLWLDPKDGFYRHKDGTPY